MRAARSRYCAANGLPIDSKTFAREALDQLMAYPWPGNIAELGSVMELASFNAEGRTIEPEHLPDSLRDEGVRPAAPAFASPVRTIREMERVAIVNALQAARGNHSKAAHSLSISRNTLYRKMKEMGVANPER